MEVPDESTDPCSYVPWTYDRFRALVKVFPLSEADAEQLDQDPTVIGGGPVLRTFLVRKNPATWTDLEKVGTPAFRKVVPSYDRTRVVTYKLGFLN